MKDSADQTTIDFFQEKRRGRPITGSAKSAKQRMQEYRKRKANKQADASEITLSVAQFEMLIEQINQLTKERDEALQRLQDERDKTLI